MSKIYYLMGKSSSGKDTIFKKIRETRPDIRTITLYTTRPARSGEKNGVEYFFVGKEQMESLAAAGRIIEQRSYHTIGGVWDYFTVDDGQIDLAHFDYLVIGTLQSYRRMKEYFGPETLVPIYIEVDDGVRLQRALDRERSQDEPKYAEMCRRFLADSEDFSEENLRELGIRKRFENTDLKQCIGQILEYMEGV